MLQQGLLNERVVDNRDQMDPRALTLVTSAKAGVPLLRQRFKTKRDFRVCGNDDGAIISKRWTTDMVTRRRAGKGCPLPARAGTGYFCGQIRNFSPVVLA